jgi:hypothetical protein
MQLVDAMCVSNDVRSLLKSYASCTYIHSILNLTFAEVLGPMLDYINKHPSKTELVKILAEEMVAAKGKCFQGRLSRLISVISGYHPGVSINISPNEQICNVVIMLKRQHTNISLDEFIKIFVLALKERDYADNVIDEWTKYVVDNY